MVKKTARKTKKSPRQGGKKPDRDLKKQLFLACLPHIGFDGFTVKALHNGAKDMGLAAAKADLLFGNCPRDLLEYFTQCMNAELEQKLSGVAQKNWKIREKVAYGVRKKIEILTPWREAERQALLLLARPTYADLGLKTLYQTCDIIWRAAGDTSTDWNFYSKRTLLAGVFTSTLLFWLQDGSDSFEDTWQFLSRRIDNVMMINKIKSAFKNRDALKAGLDIFRKFAA